MRAHATTRARPVARPALGRAALLPLPVPTSMPGPAPSTPRRGVPRERLQHPLSVYDAPLEVAA
ncbi:hypothetical protein MB84_27330 (plasmid) [Pandoraea oxalativorans]|uniref:Uncharacterized protein n=1 Tax=Pandoraea oxalativorans TaxID=573737 RepID=A0A0G3IF76_9BURK|nr:hypothetical protein MB84_27330 [Pandoraea oxalativorans]